MSITESRLMNQWARFRSELKQLQQSPTNFRKFGFFAPSAPPGHESIEVIPCFCYNLRLLLS
jgi:hypothetical protein|eukprot:COSAG06_NODE_807_length_12165_cov_8.320902_7_plen_62_part_00